jgi:ubiquinone/menaquinone biosynthesis C-methylase UbiE
MSSTGDFKIASDNLHSAREEFLFEKVRDEAIIQLKTISGKTAADIGAGTGFMSEGLLDAELKVIAVDSSPAMIEFMKEKFADIKEFKAVLTGPAVIKLEDEAVDYAFANMYLNQVEDPQEALKEIIRILKPGGKAAVTDFMMHAHKEFMKSNHHKWPGFSFPDLYDWFINAGFKNISIEKINQSCVCKEESGEEIKIDLFIACGEK